jgi:hypothetical protein
MKGVCEGTGTPLWTAILGKGYDGVSAGTSGVAPPRMVLLDPADVLVSPVAVANGELVISS